MAKINFGGVVQDARGKQNGLVYSKNGSGSYVRRKVTPVNPNTTFQQAVRSTFSNLSQQWSGLLTPSDRAAWTTFAKTYPITDVFGNSITLNGLNMYVRINAALANAGETPLEVPPGTTYTPPIIMDPGLTATIAGSHLGIGQTNADDATGDLYYVFATGNQPPGRASIKAQYRFIGVKVQATLSGTVNMYSLWAAKFGTPIAGMGVNLLISTISGAVGIPTVGQPFAAIWT